VVVDVYQHAAIQLCYCALFECVIVFLTVAHVLLAQLSTGNTKPSIFKMLTGWLLSLTY